MITHPTTRRSWNMVILAIACVASGQAAHAGCGAAPDACQIEAGSYHIELPDGGANGAPALMFLHGWGSSGAGSLTMRGMVETALGRGYAVIAPDGMPRQGRNGRTWGFHPDRPGPRDEIAFLQAVRDDAARHHGIDADRIVLGGFSIGGSMTSYLACAAPDAFAAYVPVAGSFWRPHPETCAGPVRLLHTHGWTDGTVPLEGRILRGDGGLDDPDTIAQGDVWHAMEIWRAVNGCRPNASTHADTGAFWRRTWDDCASGADLDFALFYGGHGIPPGWAEMALDWFETD